MLELLTIIGRNFGPMRQFDTKTYSFEKELLKLNPVHCFENEFRIIATDNPSTSSPKTDSQNEKPDQPKHNDKGPEGSPRGKLKNNGEIIPEKTTVQYTALQNELITRGSFKEISHSNLYSMF